MPIDITGLTKARMLAIEAASVISGAISGDNLVLTKKDGSTVNAGNVRGPQGIQGPGNATDADLASFANNTASATSTAILNRVKTQTDPIAADVASVKSSSATVDELGGSAVYQGYMSSSGTLSGSLSSGALLTVWTAPLACEITALTMSFEFLTLAKDATNWISLEMDARTAGVRRAFVTKTTKTSDGAAEAITARRPWNFDSQIWTPANAQFAKDDIMQINFTQGGTGALQFPMFISWRYRPL